MRNSPLSTVSGHVAPLMRANIDTDAISPSRNRIRVGLTDFGPFLFSEWRYDDDGQERPEFVLNQPFRRDSVFLIALDNFGCGSSRETAPWALRDFGIRCVIAPSFGSIFQNNCYRNGIVPVIMDRERVEDLGARAEAEPEYRLTLDLPDQTLFGSDGSVLRFDIAPGPKRMLAEGLDAIGLTLTMRADIEAFRSEDRARRPWIYTTSRPSAERIAG